VSVASSHGQEGFFSRERPVMGSGVTVEHEEDRKALKEKRKGEKKLQKACPNITVITPSISNEFFHNHSDNEKSKIIKKELPINLKTILL
jgi:hypothetical protein